MTKLRLPIAFLVALLAADAAQAAPVRPTKDAGAPEITVFDDGLELVVFPQPHTRRATLWLVVRAGGVNDPPGKGGLAHLTEHLALGGSHDIDGRAFFDEVRAAGAMLNAHTYPERITFELDAPADRFEALGERFLALVTSPAWQDARIASERGIIETETTYHSSEGLLSVVDLAVFPAPQQAGPLTGTSESRAELVVPDVVGFFEQSLVPANVTVLLTGAVTPERGRALVERAFRIPPARPGEGSALPVEKPVLPVSQKLQAGVVVSMLGYLVDPADRDLCPAVASLLDLRLTLAVQLSNQRVSRVTVDCTRLRGNDFLIAFAFTSTLDSTELPQTMQRAFGALASNPPSALERTLVDGRIARRVQRTLRDPIGLVEQLSVLAAERTGPRTDLGRLRPRALPPAARLSAMVSRSFTQEREVLLNFSPMQN